MLTLGSEYHEFRNVWEAMECGIRTLNTLIEKLCAIEFRSAKTNESGASVARADMSVKTEARVDN